MIRRTQKTAASLAEMFLQQGIVAQVLQQVDNLPLDLCAIRAHTHKAGVPNRGTDTARSEVTWQGDVMSDLSVRSQPFASPGSGTNMATRLALGVVLAVLVTIALLWAMRFLITTGDDTLAPSEPFRSIDFVRVERESEPVRRQRLEPPPALNPPPEILSTRPRLRSLRFRARYRPPLRPSRSTRQVSATSTAKSRWSWQFHRAFRSAPGYVA